MDKLVVPLVDVHVDLTDLGMLAERERIKVDFSGQPTTLRTVNETLRPIVSRRQQEKRTRDPGGQRRSARIGRDRDGCVVLASANGKPPTRLPAL